MKNKLDNRIEKPLADKLHTSLYRSMKIFNVSKGPWIHIAAPLNPLLPSPVERDFLQNPVYFQLQNELRKK